MNENLILWKPSNNAVSLSLKIQREWNTDSECVVSWTLWLEYQHFHSLTVWVAALLDQQWLSGSGIIACLTCINAHNRCTNNFAKPVQLQVIVRHEIQICCSLHTWQLCAYIYMMLLINNEMLHYPWNYIFITYYY